MSLGKTSRIIVDGEELMVYSNLETILRDIRSMFWADLVWIDRLCMNQSDATERASQVAMMDDIYEPYSRVQVHIPVAGDEPCRLWQEFFELGRADEYVPKRREVDAAVDLIWKIGGSKLLQEYSLNHDEGELLSFVQLKDWQALVDYSTILDSTASG